MKLATKTTVKTLGDCAYHAIEKHFQKTIKWEKSVKKDEDPEALHQMRVGMRRLRTAVSRFGATIHLPKTASDKHIGKIARILGNLRDLDVLKEALENNYQPHLLPKEQEALKIAFSTLAKQREIALINVQKILKDDAYKSFKQSFQTWLEKPTYKSLAFLPIQQSLPDLLLPEISHLLLHPAWLIGMQIIDAKIVNSKWTPEKLEECLATEGDMLHALRKQAKRVRYQMELFTEFYGEDFHQQIADVKNIQEILGTLQDNFVLREWLGNVFKTETQTQLRGLVTLLSVNSYQTWQQWQLIQARYFKTETRQKFHLTILNPA